MRTIPAADVTAGMTIRVDGAEADLHVDHSDHIPGERDLVHLYLDGEQTPYPFGRDVAVTVVAEPVLPDPEDIINSWLVTRDDRFLGPRGSAVRGATWAQQRTARDLAQRFPGSDVRTLVSGRNTRGEVFIHTYLVAGPTTPRH